MQPSICPTEKQIELSIEISTVNLRYRLHATLNLPNRKANRTKHRNLYSEFKVSSTCNPQFAGYPITDN